MILFTGSGYNFEGCRDGSVVGLYQTISYRMGCLWWAVKDSSSNKGTNVKLKMRTNGGRDIRAHRFLYRTESVKIMERLDLRLGCSHFSYTKYAAGRSNVLRN